MSGGRRKWGERLNREKRGAVNVSKDGDCADKGGEGLVKEAEWQKARRKKKKGQERELVDQDELQCNRQNKCWQCTLLQTTDMLNLYRNVNFIL